MYHRIRLEKSKEKMSPKLKDMRQQSVKVQSIGFYPINGKIENSTYPTI